MDTLQQVVRVVGDVLQLGDRARDMDRETPLLGAVPEFDSMAVVSVLTALEETYGFTVEDDEVEASTFETIGSLTDFVDGKLEE